MAQGAAGQPRGHERCVLWKAEDVLAAKARGRDKVPTRLCSMAELEKHSAAAAELLPDSPLLRQGDPFPSNLAVRPQMQHVLTNMPSQTQQLPESQKSSGDGHLHLPLADFQCWKVSSSARSDSVSTPPWSVKSLS